MELTHSPFAIKALDFLFYVVFSMSAFHNEADISFIRPAGS